MCLTARSVMVGRTGCNFQHGPLLRPHRSKLYGLTIRPDRLSRIRSERRPGSRYASARQCEYEVARAEAMFATEGLPCADSTAMSIEELASTIIHTVKLRRRVY